MSWAVNEVCWYLGKTQDLKQRIPKQGTVNKVGPGSVEVKIEKAPWKKLFDVEDIFKTQNEVWDKLINLLENQRKTAMQAASNAEQQIENVNKMKKETANV